MRGPIPPWWCRSSARFCVAVVVVSACATLSSHALCANDRAGAREHYETATRLYDIREYSKALDEYKAAYLAKPDPAFLFNIGQCYRKLKNKAAAVDFFGQYLKKIPAEDPNRMQAEARIQDIESDRDFDEDLPTKLEARTTPQLEAQAILSPLALNPTGHEPTSSQPAGLDLSVPASQEIHTSAPFYGTWWFWTGVGVAVVAGTVTAIALSSGGGGTSVPSTTLGSRSVL